MRDCGTVALGIGDDAAIIKTTPNTVVCTDLLAEGTHFIVTDDNSLHLAGRKSLAVNLSDIAAMGAVPKTAFLSLLLNRKNALHAAKCITLGLLRLAQDFQVSLAGGDTCCWDGATVINVTLTGDLIQSQPILRSTAQPGDAIVVSGSLGGSLLGKHLTFEPRCHAIEKILEYTSLHSMTDISDGLACDLNSILRPSNVGATIDAKAIPISTDAQSGHPILNAITFPVNAKGSPDWTANRPLAHSLYDGEDFELLFTLPFDQATGLIDGVHHRKLDLGCDLWIIGTVQEEKGLRLKYQDQIFDLPAGGYQH